MRKKFFNVLKYLAFFAVGAIIFWLIYRDQDIERIKSVLTNEVNYFWIFISLCLGLISHISRSARWNLMIEPLGHKPRLTNTFLAVMVGYLMNFVLPRMGEIARCGILSKYEKVSFPKLVGTVVTERIADVIVLLIFTLLMIITQFGQVISFIQGNPGIREKVISIVSSPYLIAGFIFIIVAFFVFRKALKNSRIYKKVASTVTLFKEGLVSVRNMKRKWAFIGHSFLIWFMYYLMLYVVFFSFGFTSGLSPLAALTTFVMASYGMVAPAQGGIGTWHFMAIEALAIYGVAKQDGIIFALLMHSSMTFMIIVLGLISLVVLPFANRDKIITTT